MNSYEDPALSYECDLTAQRDRLLDENRRLKEALAAANNALRFVADSFGDPKMRPLVNTIDALLHALEG